MTAPHLSPWTETDSLVFVSGQLAFDENCTLSATDIDGQTTQTRSTIVSQLVLPQALVEIEVVARRPRP